MQVERGAARKIPRLYPAFWIFNA